VCGAGSTLPPEMLGFFSLDKSRKKTIAAIVILRKKIKFVATKCHILRLKCIKFDLGWGSATDPAGGAHSAPQPPSWI